MTLEVTDLGLGQSARNTVKRLDKWRAKLQAPPLNPKPHILNPTWNPIKIFTRIRAGRGGQTHTSKAPYLSPPTPYTTIPLHTKLQRMASTIQDSGERLPKPMATPHH